jgi:hypothetical protein
MRAWPLVVTSLVYLAVPAAAQERRARVSLGYAFSTYLEEGGGNAPIGAYLSVASAGRAVGFEADVAYHRDSEEFFAEKVVLNTVIAAVGPRFELGSGNARPFLHVLGGVRYDSVEGESNTAFGGAAGGGVDIPAGSRLFVRLGADFQIFFDEGENLKTLRLALGIGF